MSNDERGLARPHTLTVDNVDSVDSSGDVAIDGKRTAKVFSLVGSKHFSL